MFAPLPLLSELDERESSEGGLDPLGLYSVADALATRLVPGVRERQSHPRFLTAIAVSLAVCEDFETDALSTDGVSAPWQVFEWYLVEGLVRREQPDKLRGLPGRQKTERAIADGVPLSARRYLKTPAVFGFHGVYRLLARTLGIEQGGYLGDRGFELLRVWSKEQGLEGFVGSAGGSGARRRNQLRDAVEESLKEGATRRTEHWSGWDFFAGHLGIYNAGRHEARFLDKLLREDHRGHRGGVLCHLTSNEGRRVWKESRDEQPFHQSLRIGADAALAELLDAIESYEAFGRLCQDAFDACLREMTLRRSKTPPDSLARLREVRHAARQAPKLFPKVAERLEPLGLALRFDETFRELAARGDAANWAERLAEHHRRIQSRKPPDGKAPWFVPFDDGSFMIRPLYRREEPPDGGGYVHPYRAKSLWSFARDLRLVTE